MKKILLVLVSVLALTVDANAQPANDNCATAQNLGNLPNPAACPSGVGANLNIAGTIVAATPSNPYIYQPGCSGAGGPNMGVPANDVWYSFTATGYQCVITISGATFANPNVAFYSGTCGALGGGIGGCAVGTGGTVTLTVEQMTPGTTYYIQVSGNVGQTGTFNMSIRNNIDCTDCLTGSTFTSTPPPVNGMYQPGQIVQFCYHPTQYNEVNTNWLHGVQFTWGAGWNPAPVATFPPPEWGGNNTGAWAWYPSCTSTATGAVFGQGFYWDTNDPGTNPGNNFGDAVALGSGGVVPAGQWNFCINLQVAAGCAPGSNLSVQVNTSGDGESGSWANIGCVDDPPTTFNAVGACCLPTMAAINISCPGANDGQATATPVGAAGPYDYVWTGPGGYTSTTNNAPGANTITGLTTAGVYTVSVTDNNNCLITNTVTVNVGAAPVASANNTGPYCAGATINLSSGAGPVDWDWTGPGGYVQNNTQNPSIGSSTVAMSGVYTVTVTSATGCTATATTTVTVNPNPTPTATNGGPYCVGQIIQLNSPTGSATDDWTGPGGYVQNNMQNPTRPGATLAMAGVYTVTVTNAFGCSATATTTVVVNPLPTPTATNTGPYCEGAMIQLNSPSGSATDDWTGPGGYTSTNTQNPTIAGSTPAMSGVYTVTVTNAAGCSATATTTVTVNPLPIPTANNTGPYCVGATIQLNSPSGFATDDWTGPGGYVQNNIQNPTIPGATVAMSGVYTVTVTTAAGCSATATTTVTVNPAGVAVANNTGPYCAGATINLTSPAGPIDWDWIGPGGYVQNNTQNPTIPGSTVAMSGVYTVTTTMAGGCTATGTTTVVVNALPTPTANNTGPYCAGATIQLNSPTGSATDDWTGPGGYTSTNTQNPTIAGSTPAMSGVYTVTVTNAAGCSATATTTVTVNANPTPTANNTGPYCTGATIQLNSPTGSATDDWTGPAGYVQNNLQNPTIAGSTVAMSGVYTVTVTNAAGCSATATTSVTVNPLPTPTANNTGPYCAGATIQLNSPTGSATDDWTGPGGYTSTNTQNPSIAGSTPAMSGVYTVTVTNAAGCSATATTSVTVNANPTPTANNTGPYCAGATIQLNSPTGSATDDWTGPGGYTSTNTQNPTIAGSTPAMSGVYTVTVTNAAGCSATATTTITVNANPTPTANNTGPYCVGTTIQLNSPTGSATDDWTGPSGYIQNNTQNPTIPGATLAMNGVYTVTVTNASGCSATATTTVTVNNLPAPTANNTGPYCAGATIQLNSPTGFATDDWTGPAGYVQNDMQNPAIAGATVAMSGVYTVTVTAGTGCSATATTTVVVNANPTPTANNTGPYCEGVTIQLNSPTGSATDDWTGPGGYTSTNAQNPTITGSTPAMSGVYTVTVTNATGCSATATTSVTVNPLPSPTANNTGPYCEGATIQLNSPTGSATDDWTGPAGYVQNNLQNPTIPASTVTMSGVYTVTVTNAAGCSATATTTVSINANPIPTANNTGPYCAGIDIHLNSPTGSATDDWAGPAGFVQNDMQNPIIVGSTVAMSGVYTVTVTNASGCSATATTTVVVNALPLPVAGNTGPVCEGSNCDLTANGGSSYVWNGPGGYNSVLQNPTIVPTTMANNGVYTVIVTDANSCSATATTTLTINALPLVLANTNAPVCDGMDVTLNGNGAFNYTWLGPNGFNTSGQSPVINNAGPADNGVYTVTGTDANNCSSTATVTVTTLPDPIPQFVGDNLAGCAPLCVNFTDQSNGNGGTINSWSWNIEGQPAINTQNAAVCFPNAGSYDATLTVTTTDGCSATLNLANYINVYGNPTASFMYTPQEINEQDPELIFASTSTGATTWAWDFGDGGNSTLENPTHLYGDTGVYCINLVVANNFGCIDTTTGCLYIAPIFSLYIPNAFTPTEDGLNEMFMVYGTGVKSIVVRIFDRWGEEIYMFDSMNKGWPGTMQNGAECKQDVYVYHIEVVDGSNDPHTFLGRVTLIR